MPAGPGERGGPAFALSSIVRPTTLAAVYAAVWSPAATRLLRAYLVIGLAFSLVVGIVVVVVLHGYTATPVARFWRAVVEVALGAAACGFAIGAGMRRGSATPDKPSRTTDWLRRRLENLTTTRAALIGVATHLPGLVDLAALNAIVNAAVSLLGAIAQVAVYNIIWYSVAIAELLVSVLQPDAAKELLRTPTR